MVGKLLLHGGLAHDMMGDSEQNIQLETRCEENSLSGCLGIWNQFVTNLIIPNIWLFGNLDQKMNYGCHPMTNEILIFM